MNSDTLQWRAYCSRVVVKHKLEDTVYNNNMKSIYYHFQDVLEHGEFIPRMCMRLMTTIFQNC